MEEYKPLKQGKKKMSDATETISDRTGELGSPSARLSGRREALAKRAEGIGGLDLLQQGIRRKARFPTTEVLSLRKDVGVRDIRILSRGQGAEGRGVEERATLQRTDLWGGIPGDELS